MGRMLGHVSQLVGQEGDLAALGKRGADTGHVAAGEIVGQEVGLRVDADMDAVAPRPRQDRAPGGAGANDLEQAAQLGAAGAGPGVGTVDVAGQEAAGHRPGVVAEGAFGVAQRHAAGPEHLGGAVPGGIVPGGIVPGRLALPVQDQDRDCGDQHDGQPAGPTPRRPPVVCRCWTPLHDLLAVRSAYRIAARIVQKAYRFAVTPRALARQGRIARVNALLTDCGLAWPLKL